MGGPNYPPSGAPPPPSGWLPPAHHRPDMMSMAARWGRLIGLLLLFVGTLVVVWIASVQAGCLATPSTCATDAQNAANAIIAGKILWSLGLLAIAGSSGIRLEWGLPRSGVGSDQDAQLVASSRRANALMVIVCIVLLFFLLLTAGTIPPVA